MNKNLNFDGEPRIIRRPGFYAVVGCGQYMKAKDWKDAKEKLETMKRKEGVK